MRVIPSAVQIPNLEDAAIAFERGRSHPLQLVFVGRLSREKQVDRLLRAWSTLHQQHPDWRLRIVGDGQECTSLQLLAQELNLGTTVVWQPWTENVWDVLKASHVFCLVSAYEGFPQSLLEAMATALPVVVSDCSPAIREVVTDQESGLILRADWDEKMLAASLSRLMLDANERLRLGRNAARVAKRYDWQAIKSEWLSLLEMAHTPS